MNLIIYIIVILTSTSVFAQKNLIFSTVPRVEVLFGLNLTSDDIQIRIESHGCTTTESFFVQKYIDSSDQQIHLNFIRVRPDWCKSFLPDGVWLKFSKSEFNISNSDLVRIDNPFGTRSFNNN